MKNIFIVILSLLMVVYSCDKVDSPYIEETDHGGGGENPDTTDGDSPFTFVQNVLVEDYTGHTCVNCPYAAEELENIEAQYGKKIIPLAIHVGSFATPYPGSTFDLDLRSTTGNELDNEFGLSAAGLPVGMVNRVVFNNDIKIGKDGWNSAVNIEVNKSPLYGIKLKSTIDTTSKNISIEVDLHVLRDTTQNLMLCVYLSEDSIIGAQRKKVDGTDITIDDYVFMHVLRTSVNGTWGEEIATTSTPLLKDDIINKKYDNFNYDATWVAKNLNIVAFVYDYDTKEIFQAELLEIEIE